MHVWGGYFSSKNNKNSSNGLSTQYVPGTVLSTSCTYLILTTLLFLCQQCRWGHKFKDIKWICHIPKTVSSMTLYRPSRSKSHVLPLYANEIIQRERIGRVCIHWFKTFIELFTSYESPWSGTKRDEKKYLGSLTIRGQNGYICVTKWLHLPQVQILALPLTNLRDFEPQFSVLQKEIIGDSYSSVSTS